MRYTNNNKPMIGAISRNTGIDYDTVEQVIDGLANYMTESLLYGDGLQIAPIGKLETKMVKPRQLGIVDKEGNKVSVPKQRKVVFKPSAQFREQLMLIEDDKR